MSGANGINGSSPFYVELCGNRTLFRLIKSSCFWIQETCGKSEFTFASSFLERIPLISGLAKSTIDLSALSSSLAKYDGALYVASSFSSGIDLGSAVYQCVKGTDGKTIRDVIYGGWKFGADLFGSLKWSTKTISVLPILNNYSNLFGVVKSFLSASLAAYDIYHASKRQWTIYWNPKNTTAEQEVDNLRWKTNVAEIVMKTGAFGLNTFAFLDSFLKPIKPMNGMIYNILGTTAGISGLFFTYYKKP